mmetsp:Transcript_1518/g.4154  ORF Transcript_1518/g.4154 Transcript_1518/m.4154 type:complete len:87 (+) Transcript_1518:902-1162(+)
MWAPHQHTRRKKRKKSMRRRAAANGYTSTGGCLHRHLMKAPRKARGVKGLAAVGRSVDTPHPFRQHTHTHTHTNGKQIRHKYAWLR